MYHCTFAARSTLCLKFLWWEMISILSPTDRPIRSSFALSSCPGVIAHIQQRKLLVMRMKSKISSFCPQMKKKKIYRLPSQEDALIYGTSSIYCSTSASSWVEINVCTTECLPLPLDGRVCVSVSSSSSLSRKDIPLAFVCRSLMIWYTRNGVVQRTNCVLLCFRGAINHPPHCHMTLFVCKYFAL